MIRQVTIAKDNYKSATGNPATNLYVGRAEWQQIAAEASAHWACEIKAPAEGNERVECAGLRVFVVNAESHVVVGRDAEI